MIFLRRLWKIPQLTITIGSPNRYVNKFLVKALLRRGDLVSVPTAVAFI
jgi:hypothetical protein